MENDNCAKSNPIRSRIILKEGYETLRDKTVVIIGLGGTGSTAAQLLSRYPLKKLILVDHDNIEHTNLERQVLYSKKDVGKRKAAVAKSRLNGFCEIAAIAMDFEMLINDKSKDKSRSLPISKADLIIDCTDNDPTRSAINRFCIEHKIPWIYTGAVGRIGAVFFISPKGPCFECFSSGKSGERCSNVGVLNSTVSMVGSLAASMAIDFLALERIEEDMIRINLDTNSWSKIKVRKNKFCKSCGNT